MTESIALSSSPAAQFNSRSMGMKFIVVCGLALLMTIPALFVGGLVQQRTKQAAELAQCSNGGAAFQQPLLGIKVADPYRSVDRSMKYLPLFLGLVFLSYFIFEATTCKRVHPAQYLLVGIAQLIFFLLLLSISEKAGFDIAFLMAGAATVALLAVNAGWVFANRAYGARAFAIFALLYLLIYLLLKMEDNALLIGSISSFLAVAAVMYFTRKIDWYSSFPIAAPGETSMPPTVPGNPA